MMRKSVSVSSSEYERSQPSTAPIAFAVLQPEREPLRRDDKPASLNAIGAVQRLLRGPGGFATERGQPVEAPLSLCSSSPFGLRDP